MHIKSVSTSDHQATLLTNTTIANCLQLKTAKASTNSNPHTTRKKERKKESFPHHEEESIGNDKYLKRKNFKSDKWETYIYHYKESIGKRIDKCLKQKNFKREKLRNWHLPLRESIENPPMHKKEKLQTRQKWEIDIYH